MATFLKDDFTGDGNISAHSVTGTGAVGGAWVSHPASSGELAIVGGFLQSGGNNNRFAYNDIDPGADDYSVTVTIGNNEGIVGTRVRHDTTTNTCYEAVHYLSPQQILLFRYVNGSQTQLAVWSGHPDCSSLRLEVSGTGAAVNLKVYKDGSTTALTPAGYNDSAAERIVSRGKAGVRAYDVSASNSGPTAIEGANALAAVATTVTLSGPTSGVTGVASTNFTVTANEAVSGSVAITPATTGTGTFSPSSPTIASGTTSTTFTYTPGVSESASISITNDGGLSVAGSPITYTSSAADTTAPTLSSATGAKTGQTTGTGGVTTNEANGTLYAFCSNSATPPSAANLKTGTGAAYSTSVAVSSTGAKSFSATGLSAATTYYWHFLHRDAAGNDSTIATSAGFTTDAAAAGSITTSPFRNLETGALMASVTFSKVLLWNRNTDTATVLSSQTSNASGQLSITGLIAGNDYAVIPADDVATVVSDTKSSVRHYRAA